MTAQNRIRAVEPAYLADHSHAFNFPPPFLLTLRRANRGIYSTGGATSLRPRAYYSMVSMNRKSSTEPISGVDLPVSRPVGRALLVASPAGRGETLDLLDRLGFECATADDPYDGIRQLASADHPFSALILGLASLYREELNMIAACKRRFPAVEVWLTQTDGRQGALVDAMRLGADGLLAEDGLHRLGDPEAVGAKLEQLDTPHSTEPLPHPAVTRDRSDPSQDFPDELAIGEPVLTADELRALLQDQPMMPPSQTDEV